MSMILIRNPLLVATMNDNRDEFNGGHILVEDGVIASIGPQSREAEADEVIDAAGMVVLPGFINTHHHLYQSLTRNIARMQNAPLFSWLNDHYQIWRELTEEAVFVSARTALLELMKSGTTTSSDHLYVFPERAGKELIDAEIRAARELGIRFQPTRGSMSLSRSDGGLPPDDVVQNEEEILKDTQRLFDLYHDSSDGAMVRISLAPCSPFSVTPELMRQTAGFAGENGLQIHTHLAESLDEERFCIEKYGKRPVEYLDSLGWISGNAWFAHAIHLNDEEIARIGGAGAGIAHCPSSNMRLGSGIARIRELLQAGASVSLAVDGTASNDSGNMLAEVRNAMMLSRLREQENWLTAREVLSIATRGGAKTLGRDDIGRLEVGKRADLALFSVMGVEYAGGLNDPLSSLVFTVRMSPVDHLIVEGRRLISDGESGVDERALVDRHNRISSEMLSRAAESTGIDFHERE